MIGVTQVPRVFVSSTRFGAIGQLRRNGSILWQGPLRFDVDTALRDAEAEKDRLRKIRQTDR
jgi:hypothetical protein